MIINLAFCGAFMCPIFIFHDSWCFTVCGRRCAGITIVVMTAAFVVLTDMEQPFSGFVQIDTTMFLLIRRDIRIVLRSAHLEQLQAIEKRNNGRDRLTQSQSDVSTINLSQSQTIRQAMPASCSTLTCSLTCPT